MQVICPLTFWKMRIWMNGIVQQILTVKYNLQSSFKKGVLHGIGCCLPIMKKNNSGHIINISSDGGLRVFVQISAHQQFDCISVYCATKYFVEGLSIGLRREVKNYNIRVTNIQPGVSSNPPNEYRTSQRIWAWSRQIKRLLVNTMERREER